MDIVLITPTRHNHNFIVPVRDTVLHGMRRHHGPRPARSSVAAVLDRGFGAGAIGGVTAPALQDILQLRIRRRCDWRGHGPRPTGYPATPDSASMRWAGSRPPALQIILQLRIRRGCDWRGHGPRPTGYPATPDSASMRWAGSRPRTARFSVAAVLDRG
jgi:hypothetical protein